MAVREYLEHQTEQLDEEPLDSNENAMRRVVPTEQLEVCAIVGSRDFGDRPQVERYLRQLSPECEIVSGGCKRGPDAWAEEFAKENGRTITVIKPDTSGGVSFGVAAYQRNIHIASACNLASGKGLVTVFWDGESKGSRNMIDICDKNAVPVTVRYPNKEYAKKTDFSKKLEGKSADEKRALARETLFCAAENGCTMSKAHEALAMEGFSLKQSQYTINTMMKEGKVKLKDGMLCLPESPVNRFTKPGKSLGPMDWRDSPDWGIPSKNPAHKLPETPQELAEDALRKGGKLDRSIQAFLTADATRKRDSDGWEWRDFVDKTTGELVEDAYCLVKHFNVRQNKVTTIEYDFFGRPDNVPPIPYGSCCCQFRNYNPTCKHELEREERKKAREQKEKEATA